MRFRAQCAKRSADSRDARRGRMLRDLPLGEAARALYIAVLAAGRAGLPHDAFVRAHPRISARDLEAAINGELLAHGLVDVACAGGAAPVVYRAVYVHGVPPARAPQRVLEEYAAATAHTLSALDANDRAVFHCVRQAGDVGIWTRDIRTRTGLHQNVMAKAVRALEGRQIIKAVRSVKHPSRKMYMLSHLEPSAQLTGGPWFSDSELDVAFIEAMRRVCYLFILSRSASAAEASAARDADAAADTGAARPDGAPFVPPDVSGDHPILPASYCEYPTAADVYRFVADSGVLRTAAALGPGDIATVVRCLAYDGLVERFVPRFPSAAARRTPGRSAKRARFAVPPGDDSGESSDDDGALDVDEAGTPYAYRAVRPALPPSAAAALLPRAAV